MDTSTKNVELEIDNPTNDSKHYYLALGILIGLTLTLGVMLISLLFRGITEFQNLKVSTSPSPSVHVTRNFMDGMISYNPDSWSLTFMVKNPKNIYILYYDDLEAKIHKMTSYIGKPMFLLTSIKRKNLKTSLMQHLAL
ncbi:hypothetical protein FXO38_20795 [Capsicum annuum]|nr:hypothetical protein FXO38_20795 [Capsicum annuum]